MKMYLRLAWQNIWRNKRRTLITVSSIFFAVLLALFTRSMQLGSYAHMIRNSLKFYTGYAQIHANGFWDDKTLDKTFAYSKAIAAKAVDNPHIELATPRLESFALASAGDLTKGAMVVGIDPEIENGLTDLKKRVEQGDYLRADDRGVLVAEGLAKYLKIGVDDTLVLIGQGYRGMSAAGKYPVVGLVKFPTPDLNKLLVYMTLAEAQYFYAADNRLTSLALLVDRQKNLPQVMNYLKSQFDETYEVMSWRDLMTEMVQLIQVDNAFGLLMIGILYIIIGFGIFGTVLMMTAERRHEFGVLVAIGLKRWQLGIMTFLETVMITVTGVLAGVITGIPLLIFMYHHPIILTGDAAKATLELGLEPVMPFSLDPTIFLAQSGVVILLSMITVLYPIRVISRFKVVEAMRA